MRRARIVIHVLARLQFPGAPAIRLYHALVELEPPNRLIGAHPARGDLGDRVVFSPHRCAGQPP